MNDLFTVPLLESFFGHITCFSYLIPGTFWLLAVTISGQTREYHIVEN